MGYVESDTEAAQTAPCPNEPSGLLQQDLDIDGMTCAACVSRVERALTDLDGVEEASVNLATETALVRYDVERIALDALMAATERVGYRSIARDGGARPRSASSPGNLSWTVLRAAVLTLPVVLISMIPPLQFANWEWVALALSAPVVLVAGWRFHAAALRNLRHGAATMDTLVSIGTLAALVWSTVALVAVDGGHVYFEVGAVITTLILLGRYLERGARRRSSAAVRRLLELEAREARIVEGEGERVVPIEALSPGGVFVARPGERVATDGIVVDGASAIDASMLTGEPVPVEVAAGDDVAGATLNTYGRLTIRATRVGSDTALARIARLVADAQAGKAPVQRLADRVAAVFVPIVAAIALSTLVAWLAITGDAEAAFTAAIAVLIVACPCALGLATPTALMVGTGRGAQLGILIRGPEILERTESITTVALDKTGTLTEGELELSAIELLDGTARDDVLRYAGAVEDASEHPIGIAVARAAHAELGTLPHASSFRAMPGVGVTGCVEGHEVEVRQTKGRITVAWDGEDRAHLTLRDTIKPTSSEAVDELRELSLEPLLVSGDASAVTHEVAAELGIARVEAGTLPHEKAALVAELQEAGEVVAMVGDGINDAPALAQADLGIALANGTDISVEAADVTLLTSDLRGVADAIRLARRVLSTIKQNLFWAFAYNVAAIPLAVAGLLNPIVAAAAMAASSLLVVGNSLRLRRFQGMRG
jgi:Cu+-exporting ATPase